MKIADLICCEAGTSAQKEMVARRLFSIEERQHSMLPVLSDKRHVGPWSGVESLPNHEMNMR
jgi:hypothetical protein